MLLIVIGEEESMQAIKQNKYSLKKKPKIYLLPTGRTCPHYPALALFSWNSARYSVCTMESCPGYVAGRERAVAWRTLLWIAGPKVLIQSSRPSR